MTPGAIQPGALPDAFPNASSTGNASLNGLQTIPGVERYPFQGFFNPYAAAEHGGIQGIIDVIALSVNWGGPQRPSLDWMPWDDLQAYARSYANLVMAYPRWWSVMDDGDNGEVWLYPAPSLAAEMEVDAFCVPTPLYTDNDVEALPDAFAGAVKFQAASLAFLASGRYAQSDVLNGKFLERLVSSRVSVDRGKTPSYYYGS
jgi:hypothetical protein